MFLLRAVSAGRTEEADWTRQTSYSVKVSRADSAGSPTTVPGGLTEENYVPENTVVRLAIGDISDLQAKILGKVFVEVYIHGHKIARLQASSSNDKHSFNCAVTWSFTGESTATLKFLRRRLGFTDRLLGDATIQLRTLSRDRREILERNLPICRWRRGREVNGPNEDGVDMSNVVGFIDVLYESFTARLAQPLISKSFDANPDGEIDCDKILRRESSGPIKPVRASIKSICALALCHTCTTNAEIFCVLHPPEASPIASTRRIRLIAGERFGHGVRLAGRSDALSFVTKSREMVIELKRANPGSKEVADSVTWATCVVDLSPLASAKSGTTVHTYGPIMSTSSCCTGLLEVTCAVSDQLCIDELKLGASSPILTSNTLRPLDSASLAQSCSDRESFDIPSTATNRRRVAFGNAMGLRRASIDLSRCHSKDRSPDPTVSTPGKNQRAATEDDIPLLIGRKRRSAIIARFEGPLPIRGDIFTVNPTTAVDWEARSEALMRYKTLGISFYGLGGTIFTSQPPSALKGLLFTDRERARQTPSEMAMSLDLRLGDTRVVETALYNAAQKDSEHFVFSPPIHSRLPLACDRYLCIKLGWSRRSGVVGIDLQKLMARYNDHNEATIRATFPVFMDNTGPAVGRLAMSLLFSSRKDFHFPSQELAVDPNDFYEACRS